MGRESGTDSGLGGGWMFGYGLATAGETVTEPGSRGPGIAHTELPTPDIEATRAFYEDTLGFETVIDTTGHIEEGGKLRHLFFRCGDGQLIAFMEARDVDGLSSPGDVAEAAGVVDPMLHIAFEAGSVEELEQRRARLAKQGVEVSPVIDFEWCRSFYFKDPHGLMVEFTCIVDPPPEGGEPESYELSLSVPELENFAGLS